MLMLPTYLGVGRTFVVFARTAKEIDPPRTAKEPQLSRLG